MTATQTNPAHEANNDRMVNQIRDSGRIYLLVLASAIIARGHSTSDLVQALSQASEQELRDLAVAIGWLDDDLLGSYSSTGSPKWLVRLDQTQIATCRRRWTETGITEYLLELTCDGEILATLWLATDPSGEGLLAFCWPGSLIDTVCALKLSERPRYRPFRKVSPAAAKQSLGDAWCIESPLLTELDELSAQWQLHHPLVRFVLEDMQWAPVTSANSARTGCS